jgi:hypothetical protein
MFMSVEEFHTHEDDIATKVPDLRCTTVNACLLTNDPLEVFEIETNPW